MHIKFLLLNLTLLFFACAQTSYQTLAAESSLSIEQLEQDFALFRLSLEEGHPGIYRYIPKNEMNGVFSRARRAIKKPLSPADFYCILAPVLAAIKCGHSELFPRRL